MKKHPATLVTSQHISVDVELDYAVSLLVLGFPLPSLAAVRLKELPVPSGTQLQTITFNVVSSVVSL